MSTKLRETLKNVVYRVEGFTMPVDGPVDPETSDTLISLDPQETDAWRTGVPR